VWDYVAHKIQFGHSVDLAYGSLYPTFGPEHRYSAVLFVEKEGFAALLAKAAIAERFDIAMMSTKGMSVIAARRLLDHLADKVDKILVAHDFDVSGFKIFGTLGTDGRRYEFENKLPIYDIGLRLHDVQEMDLSFERWRDERKLGQAFVHSLSPWCIGARDGYLERSPR
jgi:DNA topoisomerase VI subunit A